MWENDRSSASVTPVSRHEPAELSTGADDFGASYYAHDCGSVPYARSEEWLGMFDRIAEWVIRELEPVSVLDAGCAFGLLVERLRARDAQAWGVDVSAHAIQQVHSSVSEFCRHGSLTDPLPDRYDLVVCIEVLEHMESGQAEVAIDNLCAASDRILFSSTPADYGEATHVNVRQPEDWVASFAARRMFRNLDFDASLIAPWAMLLERGGCRMGDVVRTYDRALRRSQTEARELRRSVLEQQRNYLVSNDRALLDENALLRTELSEIRVRLKRYEPGMEDDRRLLETRGGRLLRAYHAARAALRGPRL